VKNDRSSQKRLKDEEKKTWRLTEEAEREGMRD
jgi:hypothetical protein